jgi:hypothetical protein
MDYGLVGTLESTADCDDYFHLYQADKSVYFSFGFRVGELTHSR